MKRLMSYWIAALVLVFPISAWSAPSGEDVGRCLEAMTETDAQKLRALEAVCRSVVSQDANLGPAAAALAYILSIKGEYSEMVEWAQKAADLNVPGGYSTLAWSALTGNGQEVDEAKAIGLYEKAAILGHRSSASFLLDHYSAKDDYRLALKFGTIAGELGDLWAQWSVGFIYSGQYDIAANPGQVRYWYEKAAGQTPDSEWERKAKAHAIFGLGLFMLTGEAGYSQDISRAKTMFRQAADLGMEQGGEILADLTRLEQEQNAAAWGNFLANLLVLAITSDGGDEYTAPAYEEPRNYECEGAMAAYAWSGKESGMAWLC